MLFCEEFLGDEFAGSELDGVCITIGEVGCTGEFEGGVTMTDGKCNLASDEIGVRGEDGSTDNVTVAIGKEFDETIL